MISRSACHTPPPTHHPFPIPPPCQITTSALNICQWYLATCRSLLLLDLPGYIFTVNWPTHCWAMKQLSGHYGGGVGWGGVSRRDTRVCTSCVALQRGLMVLRFSRNSVWRGGLPTLTFLPRGPDGAASLLTLAATSQLLEQVAGSTRRFGWGVGELKRWDGETKL